MGSLYITDCVFVRLQTGKRVSTMTIANTSKKKGAHNEYLINQ